jgi:hypothetical protein
METIEPALMVETLMVEKCGEYGGQTAFEQPFGILVSVLG